MTAEKALKKSVRYYVYLMCFLAAIALLGSSRESLVMRILAWLFFCLVIYRSLYKYYFIAEAERKSLAPFYESQHLPSMNVLRAVVAFFLLWIITYATLKTFVPIPLAYANLIAFANGLIYSFFLCAKVFVD
jgi:hypothetical protein